MGSLVASIERNCSFMSKNIKEKVVVITGASSGLGEATARLLSAQGQALCWGHGASIASSH